jgi:rRNA small subunit pseudouridine methyltransferase Nep1
VKLIIVLADAELELVPDMGERDAELEAVQSMHSIPVLDAYFHHDLMRGLPEAGRRGRGDIVHNFLSLCQNSISNRKGILSVYVHTRDDQVIAVEPGTEIVPNYIQFLNQMGTLLKGGQVDGYSLSHKTVKELIAGLNADVVISMTPNGSLTPLKELMDTRSSGSMVVVIGGFPEGDYKSPVDKIADMRVSLGPKLLTPQDVVSRVLAAVPKGAQHQ